MLDQFVKYLEYTSLLWNFVEPFIFVFVIGIFFRDPVRRWNFFGYRPTAVMGIFDPELEKVIFSKVNGFWSFNQGGIYEDNMYATAADILNREVGLPQTRFKLIYFRPLGKIKLQNKRLLTRARISAFSIRSKLRGKGYLGCFVRCNLQDVERMLKKGAGIEEIRVVNFEEAKRLTNVKCDHEEHQIKKREMIISMICEMEAFSKDENKWRTSRNKAPQLGQEETQESGD